MRLILRSCRLLFCAVIIIVAVCCAAIASGNNAGAGRDYGSFLERLLGVPLKEVRVSNKFLSTGDKWKVVYFLDARGREGVVLIDSEMKHVITGTILSVENGKLNDEVFAVVKAERLIPERRGGSSDVSLSDVSRGAVCIGRDNSPVIYVFFDPLCPYCTEEIRMLSEKVREGKVRLCLRYFIVHGSEGRDEAVSAECVRRKKGNDAYLKFLSASSSERASMKVECDEGMKQAAQRLVDESTKGAIKLGIRGTPTAVIPRNGRSGRVYVGYRPWSFYESVIKKGGVGR